MEQRVELARVGAREQLGKGGIGRGVWGEAIGRHLRPGGIERARIEGARVAVEECVVDIDVHRDALAQRGLEGPHGERVLPGLGCHRDEARQREPAR